MKLPKKWIWATLVAFTAFSSTVAVRVVLASCSNIECQNSDCWRVSGTLNTLCREFDYSTAKCAFGNSGSQAETANADPEQDLQFRNITPLSSCTKQCTSKTTGASSGCDPGQHLEWLDGGKKKECDEDSNIAC